MTSPPRRRRSSDAAPPTDAQLISWFQTGELLDQIAGHFGVRGLEAFRDAARRTAALATAGGIDLLSLIESGAVAAYSPTDFFTIQHFFTVALPDLDEPVPRMLAAVEALVKQGGADLAANRPNGALKEWLRKDSGRAEAIVTLATAGDAVAAANLTFALEVLGDPARARAFLGSIDMRIRASGLTALSRMADPDPASRLESIRLIGQALGDGDDEMLCANAIVAVLAIAGQDSASEAEPGVAVLRAAVGTRGDGVLNRAANALWANDAAVRPQILAVLLDALEDVNPKHKGTLDELDLGLKAALDAGRGTEVLDFLAALLVKNRGQLEVGVFHSVWNTLVFGPHDALSRWIVAWLLSGETALGAALTEVLSQVERGGTALSLDRTALPSSAAELGYLSRKAVGWFMLQPHLATAVLIAVLGVCDVETARSVAGLLAHPILRNYPDMREALSAIPAADPAKRWTDAATKASEHYLAALQAMPDIPELRPSEHNRRIHHLHQADEMSAAHKAAQAKSVFMSLVRRSTLLYGVRSLTYVEDLDGGERRPLEMELGKHEFSMTLPRLDMLDPIGLQLMLIQLRGEPRPQ